MGMSIKTIAEKVGVSYVTVSRALNHPDKVNLETRLKIQKVVKEMGFKPRVITNSLNTVNFLMPSPEHLHPLDGIVFSRIALDLAGKGFHTVVSPDGAGSPQNLFHKAYVGILRDGDDRMASFVNEHSRSAPFVVINDFGGYIAPRVTLVGSDHGNGTTKAVEYLLKKGHTRIGYVGNNPNSRGHRERFEAYKTLMGESGLLDEDLVFFNDGGLLLEGLKRLCSRKVTALFIAEEELTLRAIYYLELIGRKVPDDISLVAKECDGGMEFLYPPLTCVVQPLRALCDTAVGLVVRLVEGGKTVVPRKSYVPYGFIERESVIRVG